MHFTRIIPTDILTRIALTQCQGQTDALIVGLEQTNAVSQSVSQTWHLFWSVKIDSSIVSALIPQMLSNKIYLTNLTAFKCSPKNHKGIKMLGCSGYKWLNFFTPASTVLLFMQSILSSNDNNNQMLAARLHWFFQASKQRNTHNFTLSRLFILIWYL